MKFGGWVGGSGVGNRIGVKDEKVEEDNYREEGYDVVLEFKGYKMFGFSLYS